MPVLRQLPRWAWIGGGVLAFTAGMVNTAGFLGFRHQSITNLTGSTTLLGISLGAGHPGEILHWVLTIGAFVAGAVLSGAILQKTALKLGPGYVIALLLESLLLIAAVPLLDRSSDWGLYLASVATGLQNGMASTYSGMVFRTTHVTGMLTDLGMYLGHRLRGHEVDRLRISVSVLVATTFMFGGAAGALLFGVLGERTLLIPAAITGIGALLCDLHRRTRQ